MNIIARAAIYIYDGSPISPVFPAKAGKPSDDAGEYLSSVAEKLMGSDTSRTTYVAEAARRRSCSGSLPTSPLWRRPAH